MADSNKPKYPPGFRFVPKDEELIIYYLQLKIDNEPIPVDEINEVDLYANNPKALAEEFPSLGENEWYFFTPRERKYRNGLRPKRSAENGYWKATGSDKRIDFEGKVVGFKKSLVFYQGPPQKGTKTDWIMHEYRVNRPPRTRTNATDMKLDDWVLCRIYKKAPKGNNNNNDNNSNVPAIVPPAESDHVTTPDQVDPTAIVASSDEPITALVYQQVDPLEGNFEEQGQEVAPLQGFEQEPLMMPLVAPPDYTYCSEDTHQVLVDNNGSIVIGKHELVEEGFSDSWYDNMTLEPLNENQYHHNGYGVEQGAYWNQNDRNWTCFVTQNDGDFTSLLQNNNGSFTSSASSNVQNSSSVQNYGSYCDYLESAYAPPLGANYSSVDGSMKSEALINPPDHNQLVQRPRKRLHVHI